MEEREIFEKLKLPRRLFFLIELALKKIDDLKSLPELEKELGYNHAQCDAREIFNFLLNLKILTLEKQIYRINVYKINNKKLVDLIDSLESTKKYHEYFHEFHFAV